MAPPKQILPKPSSKPKLKSALHTAANGTPKSEMTISTAAPQGDLILIVGTTASKIRGSSNVLSSASVVFEALLGPHFLEGQQAGTSEHPKEIILPEDDATAMSDMICLLHNKQVKDLIVSPTADRLLAFAIVVDKYDCVDALQIQIQGILLAYPMSRADLSFTDCTKNLLASYLLNHAWTFKQLCARAICQSKEPFITSLGANWAKLYPGNLIYALEHKRSAVQQRIVFDLPTIGITECPGDNCININNHTLTLNGAFKIPFWPPTFPPRGTCTLSAALETIKDLGNLKIAQVCHHRRYGAKTEEVSSKIFINFADELMKDCVKLCLGCIKAGKMDFTDQCMNEEHFAAFKVMAGI